MFEWLRKTRRVPPWRMSEAALGDKIEEDNLDEFQAERIVNKYGEALGKVNVLNAVEVLFILSTMKQDKQLRSHVSESLKQKHGYYFDLFSRKLDKSILPYPKEKIRKAIYLLLKLDTDPNNIRLLKAGLQYLDYFE